MVATELMLFGVVHTNNFYDKFEFPVKICSAALMTTLTNKRILHFCLVGLRRV